MKSFVSFDGIRIAYQDEGAGPAVILLHGFGVDGLQNFGHFDLSRPMLERTISMFRGRWASRPRCPSPRPRGGRD